MKNLILTIVTILIALSNINSQNLIPIGDHFLYGEKYINKNQVKNILQKNPDAYKYYNKSQNQFITAKAFGVTSIVCLSSGLLITLASAPAALISESAADTAGFGLILMLGGCVTGTIGLVKKSKAKRNLEVSLLIHNQRNSESNSLGYDIDLSFNGNGGGITYTF